MSGYGLQKFRENLTLAYLNDVVDVDDFVYLYAANGPIKINLPVLEI